MDRQIRVAQVIGMAVNGGTEAFAMNYYKHIDRTKVQFDFLVESTSKIIDKQLIESMGGRVVIIPSYKNPIKYMKILTNIFKKNKYDIVHSNMNALSVFTLRAAKKAGIKVRIAHSHSTSNKKEWKKNIIKNILRPFSKLYATNFFACSELAGRWLFGNKYYDKGLVKIINNAIDIDLYEFNSSYRQDIRNKLKINDEFVVGHVGRFMPQKNQEFLIDVFNDFHCLYDNSKLLLIGDGPQREMLVNKVKTLGLSEHVVFAGTHEDIYKYYSAMDIFVFPSLYEGLGITLVEAQANGLPCIASTNVPKAAKVLQTTDFFDLKHRTYWLETIVKFFLNNKIINRSILKYSFKQSFYDIDSEAEKLLINYQQLTIDKK